MRTLKNLLDYVLASSYWERVTKSANFALWIETSPEEDCGAFDLWRELFPDYKEQTIEMFLKALKQKKIAIIAEHGDDQGVNLGGLSIPYGVLDRIAKTSRITIILDCCRHPDNEDKEWGDNDGDGEWGWSKSKASEEAPSFSYDGLKILFSNKRWPNLLFVCPAGHSLEYGIEDEAHKILSSDSIEEWAIIQEEEQPIARSFQLPSWLIRRDL